MTSRTPHRLGSAFGATLGFAAAAVLLVAAAPAGATTVDNAYSMHSCRFRAFNDNSTCPASGFCLPPAAQVGKNIFTQEGQKLQPRTETTAGTPLSFICPITRTLSGSSASITAEVAGGAASDANLSCTLYSATKTGTLTGSASTGSTSTTTNAVIRNLKNATTGSDDNYTVICSLPVFQPKKLSRTGWTGSASISNNGEPASNLVDSGTNTRWSTGVPMANGQWIKINMGASQEVQRVVMKGPDTDYARGYKVEVSTNNSTWLPALTTGVGNGATVQADFVGITGQYVRITQTGSSNFWWSIYDVDIYVRDTSKLGSTLNGYRSEEVSTSTNLKSRTYPATVCTPKAPKTLNAKVRYNYDGLINRDTANMTVECALANPFGNEVSRTATIALTEAKSTGGSTCKITSRYAFYDDNYASGIAAKTTTASGENTWSFTDSTNYGDWVRFGLECTLTPNSAIRMLRLTTQ